MHKITNSLLDMSINISNSISNNVYINDFILITQTRPNGGFEIAKTRINKIEIHHKIHNNNHNNIRGRGGLQCQKMTMILENSLT